MLRLRARPIGFIEPCQPTTAPKPPIGPGWIHEIKHDGYRMMALRAGERVRLITRNGHDWGERFPAVVKALELLTVQSCLIDGELVVADGRGLAVFDLLRHGHRIKPQAHLVAFDLLEVDGRALVGKAIELRKAELAKLIRRAGAGLQLCAHIDQPGDLVYAHACQLGCEGS